MDDSFEMKFEVDAALGEALSAVAKQHRHLIEDLNDLHEYLWGEYCASNERYNAAFERDDKEGMAKALCRTRAYADAADRLNDILQQKPKP